MSVICFTLGFSKAAQGRAIFAGILPNLV